MLVLVVGATGSVGGSVVSQLLALPSPPSIRVCARDPSTATFPASVEVVQADLADASCYSRVFAGVDRCFLYVNPTFPFVDLCQAPKLASVQRVVLLSSFMVPCLPDTALGTVHSQAEKAVLAAQLSYTFLRPAIFAKNTFWWLAEIQGTSTVSVAYPNAHCAPVAVEDIAAVAVVALTTDRLLGATANITGPESLSDQQMVSKISELRQREGKSAVHVTPITAEQWKQNNSFLPPPLQDSLIRYWKLQDGVNEAVETAEKWTGRPATSFEQHLQQNKAVYLK